MLLELFVWISLLLIWFFNVYLIWVLMGTQVWEKWQLIMLVYAKFCQISFWFFSWNKLYNYPHLSSIAVYLFYLHLLLYAFNSEFFFSSFFNNQNPYIFLIYNKFVSLDLKLILYTFLQVRRRLFQALLFSNKISRFFKLKNEDEA